MTMPQQINGCQFTPCQRARDAAHLAEIAAALHADPFGNPYSRP